MLRAISAASVISTNTAPSGKRVREFARPTRSPQETAGNVSNPQRALYGNFITDEYTPTLRLESELSDLRVGYANPYSKRKTF